MAISVVSVSGLTPTPLAAQEMELVYEGDSLALTYRKGFGADVSVEMSIDLVSWLTIQGEDEVIALDSEGEEITSTWTIDAIQKLFFRLRKANARNVTLTWDAPLDHSISGYLVHYGTASNSYTGEIDVGYLTRATIFLPQSISVYFLMVTAYNAARLESSPSNELKVDLH